MMKKLTERGFSALPGAGKIMKTTFLCVAATVLLGLGLSAGCGSDESTSECGDAFCIGLLLPGLPEGPLTERAARIAMEDVNAAGGNIKFVTGDHDKPRESVEKLLAMGVDGLLGPVYSSRVSLILEFITSKKLVAISSVSTSAQIADDKRDLRLAGKGLYLFRTIPNDHYQAKLLEEIAPGEVLVIYRDDIWGKRLAEDIDELMQAKGRPAAKLVSYEEYQFDDADADEEARKVVEKVKSVDGIGDVDSIIMATFLEGGLMIKHMKDMNVVPSGANYYITSAWASHDLWKQVDPQDPTKVEGFIGVVQHPEDSEREHEFEARLHGELGAEDVPLHFGPYAYDAVMIMALAALKAGSTDPSEYASEVVGITREGTDCETYAECAGLIRDGADINYHGVSGPIEFDDDGEVSDGFFAVYTYDGMKGRTERFVEETNE